MLDLLPRPKNVERGSGTCRLTSLPKFDVCVADERINGPVARLGELLPKVIRTAQTGRSPGPARIRVCVAREKVAHPQGYRLTVAPESIVVDGGSPAGCFYGLQTLRQLVGFNVPGVEKPAIPCCTIADAPDFDTRGLLHDVSRGKVPTLQTLQLLADRLAGLKVNQLQLYIEHAFVFPFDAEICTEDEGLTPEEIKALDGYCRERFIDLVPAVATLGHMGRILSMPKYRHLAEIEAARDWSRMTWPQRVRGLTLDCRNPEAFGLVERMWHDVLDAFSSPVVNICGDEPGDLGRGRNRLVARERGEAYTAHLVRTYDVCAGRGRRVQCWSDVLRNHPDQLAKLPRDLTVLHWGYDDNADYEGTRAFVRHGLDTLVCPGTSGWKRVINAIDLAERNIATFAQAGQRYGAKGLLNTDWGDHGHFNALACSWHGIAAGAAHAWRVGHPIGEAFDRAVATAFAGVSVAAGFSFLRRATVPANGAETWRQLWRPLEEVAADETLPSIVDAEASAEIAAAAEQFLSAHESDEASAADLAELEVACRFQQLWAQRVAFAHRYRSSGPDASASAEARREWCARLAQCGSAFAECWMRRNKAAGLDQILAALAAVSRGWHAGGPQPHRLKAGVPGAGPGSGT